jgi:hypothetical protein
MNWKKWFLSGVAGLVVMFALSGLWYQVLTAGQHTGGLYEKFVREHYNMLFLLLGYAVLAFLMAKIYPIGYKGGAPFKEGLVFGALIGLVVGLSNNLVYYAVWNVSLSVQLLDSAWQVVEKGFGGLAIALVWGKITDLKKS